jgi:hypothetical protein
MRESAGAVLEVLAGIAEGQEKLRLPLRPESFYNAKPG